MGAIPSGSNPSGWVANDPNSNPGSGFDSTALNVNGINGSIVGAGLSALAQRSQAAITQAMASNVSNNETWSQLSNEFFSGLSPDGSAYLPTLIFRVLTKALGIDGVISDVEDSFNQLQAWGEQLVKDLQPVWDALTSVYSNFWAAVFGDPAAQGKILSDFTAAVAALTSVANTAKANAESSLLQMGALIDGALGSGHDAQDLAAYLVNTWDELVAGWNNLWAGVFGTPKLTDLTADDVLIAAASVSGAANTAKTNADNALMQFGQLVDSVLGGGHGAQDLAAYLTNTWNELESGWNSLWDGVFGTSGSTGKTSGDVKVAVQSVASTANTASTNAVAAQSAASAADTKAANAASAATAAQSTANKALPQTLWNLAQAGGTNLVISPDFQDSTIVRPVMLPGGSTAGYSTEQKRSGTQSYKIVTSPTPGKFSGVQLLPTNTSTLLKVQPGQWFYGELYIYGASTNTGSAAPWWRLNLYDSTGVKPVGIANFQNPHSDALAGKWTKLSGVAQIPDGYDTAMPVLYVNSTVASQAFYIDDVRVVEQTAAQLAQAAATAADGKATAAQAAADAAGDNFAAMLDQALGAGHGVADFVNWLQATRDNANAANDQFNDLLHGLLSSGFTIPDLITFFQGVQANADTAADNWANLTDDLLGTGHGIADVVDWMQETRDDVDDAIKTGDWTPLLNALFGGASVGTTIQVGAVPTLGPTHLDFGTIAADFEQLAIDIANPFSGWANIGADVNKLVHDFTGTAGTAPAGLNLDPAIRSAPGMAASAQASANALHGALFGVTNIVYGASNNTDLLYVEDDSVVATLATFPAAASQRGMCFDPSTGSVYVSGTGTNSPNYVSQVKPDGTITQTPLPSTFDVAIGPDGTLYSALSNTIGVLAPGASSYTQIPITTPTGGSAGVKCVAVDAAGNIYTASPIFSEVYKIAPDGTQTTLPFTGPWSANTMWGIAVDSQGNVFVTDYAGYRVWRLDTNGVQTNLAPYLYQNSIPPYSVQVDAADNILVSANRSAVYRFAPDGTMLEGIQFPLGSAITGIAVNSVVSSAAHTIRQDVIPNLPTSQIIGFNNQVDDLAADILSAFTTGDWTDLLNDLFPSGDTSKALNTNKIPNLPTSQITGLDTKLADLAADFNTAVTTGDWSALLADLFIGGDSANNLLVSKVPNLPTSRITGLTDSIDNTRRSINFVLGQLGFGYLNTSWVWTSGTPSAGDLPTGSGWSNPGGAPPAWLADILKAIGVPVANDLPSQLDASIPAAPTLGWPIGGGSSGTSVPQGTNLYYVATVVDSATLKESAPSNEVMIWSMPSILGSKNQATLTWSPAPPAGKTISLYRRQSATGQYRRIASGRTGTSYTDTDPATTVTTQPGSAEALTAGVVNGIRDKAVDAATDAGAAQRGTQAVADGIHQVVYGGNATGTPLDAAGIVQALQQFPQQNIAVNTNAGNTDPITFDAAAPSMVGTGAYTGTTKTISWTAVVGASANYLLVPAVFDDPENVAIATFSATATSDDGLVTVPLLQFSSPNDVVAVLLGAFVNPGTYTIEFTVTTASSATWNGFAATSVSYGNVNSVGVGGYNHGGKNSTALTLTTGQAVNDARSRSVVLFANRAASASASALSSMTGATQRTNKTFASTHGLAIALGDTPASPSANTFGMTSASASGNSWVVAEILLQAPDPDVGSFGRIIRGSTTPVTLSAFGADSSGVPPLPTNTFDNVESLSADLKTPNMNCFQVTLGGQYWVRGRYVATAAAAGSQTINSDGSIDGTIFVANMYVVVNGIIRTFAAAPTTAATLEYQTVVDLKPGDVVSVIPGGSLTSYHTTPPAPPSYTGVTTLGSPGSWQIVGDSKWFTVMEIALCNRSLL